MEDNLLEELLSIANSDAPAEFGSGNQHLLSQPLSHWESGDAEDHSFRYLWNAWELRIYKPGGISAAAGFPVVYKDEKKAGDAVLYWLLLSSSRKDVTH